MECPVCLHRRCKIVVTCKLSLCFSLSPSSLPLSRTYSLFLPSFCSPCHSFSSVSPFLYYSYSLPSPLSLIFHVSPFSLLHPSTSFSNPNSFSPSPPSTLFLVLSKFSFPPQPLIYPLFLCPPLLAVIISPSPIWSMPRSDFSVIPMLLPSRLDLVLEMC